MTARRRWLVGYDISDDARLRKVHDVVRSHGDRIQYSLFLCELDTIEKIGLMTELRAVIDHRHDSIVFIDLGEPGRRNAARIQFMGTPVTLSSGGPTIV